MKELGYRNSLLDESNVRPSVIGRREPNVDVKTKNNMASPKKKATAKTAMKFKDLKSKKNPKGGSQIASLKAQTVSTAGIVKAPATGWIEIDSFSFGASRSSG
jgi:hypothetical protein